MALKKTLHPWHALSLPLPAPILSRVLYPHPPRPRYSPSRPSRTFILVLWVFPFFFSPLEVEKTSNAQSQSSHFSSLGLASSM
ncbi:hypothetical protein M408DRAFT_200518 [Serendipita vermifera MAFF 305830]|uniref:Uncharacterized protein n=1 Tax=Serendipita vermifera MAFF 305830 TaxID=933852 RepID=A0A0C3B3R0_SERVB|nr:hypothetical protein M408DRAFT_200518 [Serendipita vermifera MAFF 305830]